MPTESKMPNYGGQALMEGVLMRGSKYVAMAVRSPEGQILRHVEKLEGIYTTNIKKWPFVRGVGRSLGRPWFGHALPHHVCQRPN